VNELRAFFTALAQDRETRVVVLRGAGRAFCAGLDLKSGGSEQAGSGTVSGGLRGQRHISELALMMRRLPQVFVACVHGPACGGGFMLALASDIRLAGESARMNAAFIKLGLSGCDVGVSYLLPRLVGASVAAELIRAYEQLLKGAPDGGPALPHTGDGRPGSSGGPTGNRDRSARP
jgi:enoyl-CoA hydratase